MKQKNHRSNVETCIRNGKWKDILENIAGKTVCQTKEEIQTILRKGYLEHTERKGIGWKEASIQMNCQKGGEFFTTFLCH
jgi:hypothetical protein